MEMPIQINGRLRSRLVVPLSAGKEELEAMVLADPRVRKYLGESTIRKVIIVPRKLINIVAS